MAKHSTTEDEIFDADSKLKLETAHKIADRPEEFAKLFCCVADTQNNIRKKLTEILVLSIQHDVPSRKEIKKAIKEIYDEDWRGFLRSVWGKISLVVGILVSALIGAWINSRF